MTNEEWMRMVRKQYAEDRKSFVAGLLSMTANNSSLRKISDGLKGLVVTVGDEILYISEGEQSFHKGTITGFDEQGFIIYIDGNPVPVIDSRERNGLRFVALSETISIPLL